MRACLGSASVARWHRTLSTAAQAWDGLLYAERRGDYADALSKGHRVVLMGCESTGALHLPFALLLRTLGKAATAPGTHDGTAYGTGRASPSGFFAHHVAAISAAVTHADAVIALNAASTMSFKLSMGLLALS